MGTYVVFFFRTLIWNFYNLCQYTIIVRNTFCVIAEAEVEKLLENVLYYVCTVVSLSRVGILLCEIFDVVQS